MDESKEKQTLGMIEKYAKDVLENLVDPHFTDHSIEHSYRILKIINKILLQTNNKNLLTNLEKYVIKTATFLHDIGMQEEKKVVHNEERRQLHENLSSWRIKKDFRDIGIVEDLVEPICKVVELHRGSFSEEDHKMGLRTCDEIRINLLGALLFLGDELDVTHERVDFKNVGRLAYDIFNYLHFYKHYYTENIDVKEDRGVTVAFRFPIGRKEKYSPITKKLVFQAIKDALNKSKYILNKHSINIFFNQEAVIFNESSVLSLIEESIYEQIMVKMFLQKIATSLREFDFKKMEQSSIPELFYKGNTRWEDIVDDLDIRRSQYIEFRDKLKTLYHFSCREQCQSLLLLVGEAGAGKSTMMMREAYDMVHEDGFSDSNLLWYSGIESYDMRKVINLYYTYQKPIVMFIDITDMRSFSGDIIKYRDEIESSKIPIVMIIGARRSEWDNSKAKEVLDHLNKEIVALGHLKDSEIKDLVQKLDKYDSLGKLKDLTSEQRFSRLKEHCESQLLVAMLEATEGKPFKDIIINEYKNLKRVYPDAAKAYELIALFHMYSVSTPISMLKKYLTCYDDEEYERKVIKHTRLIIVRDQNLAPYGKYYKTRHREIANILISHLPGFKTDQQRLKTVGAVYNLVDFYERVERYYIINFLRSYIEIVTQHFRSGKFDDMLYEIKKVLLNRKKRIDDFLNRAREEQDIAQLVLLANIFYKLGMIKENEKSLKKILEINPFDKITNYRLAKTLQKIRDVSAKEVVKYYKHSYQGGNRRINFLIEYISYCVKNGLYEDIDPFIDGIEDFATYNKKENKIKKNLEVILEGYRRSKDSNRLTKDMSTLINNFNLTKKLSIKGQIAYIETYESSDPKNALSGYQTYLEQISPNRPKNLLFKIAYIASKLPAEIEIAKKYYEELYSICTSTDEVGPEDFDIIYNYFKLAIRNNFYKKQRYHELFRIAKKMNPNELSLYLLFAEYLIKEKTRKDLESCEKVIDEGLEMAAKLDKIHLNSAQKLRYLKKRL